MRYSFSLVCLAAVLAVSTGGLSGCGDTEGTGGTSGDGGSGGMAGMGGTAGGGGSGGNGGTSGMGGTGGMVVDCAGMPDGTECDVDSICLADVCSLSACGDAYTDATALEECDDGNTVTEACTYGEMSCTVCADDCTNQPGAATFCGDGVVQASFEDCDGTACPATFSCVTCECIRSGIVDMASSEGYDFSLGTSGSVTHGDFYFLFQSGAVRFWANNLGMQGLVDVGVTNGPLQDVPIPATGYNRQGVLALAGHTYVSPAEEGEDDWFIIFLLNTVDSTNANLTYVYVNRP